ncbi:hypothetical protein GF386_00585, partial [Candidatus Pacearchaeota archaeon]|nr:hypothetical protein [Candidatus Pacearchaeota archaeon]
MDSEKNKILNRNIAFIHIPRTAGSYLSLYIERLLKKKNYHILNSWPSLKRDWNDEELLFFLKGYKSPLYVHNHYENWKSKIFYEYKKKGWFIFSFIRHPGDRLCSAYFMWDLKSRWKIPLNDFIKKNFESDWLNKNKKNGIPSFWRDMDFIAEFSHKSFAYFLKNYFDHDYIPTTPVLASSNMGYDYYCKKGEISKEVQKLIEESEEYRTYLKIRENFKNISNKKQIKSLSIKNNEDKINENTKHKKIIPKEDFVDFILNNYSVITDMMTKSEIKTVLNNLKIVLDRNIPGEVVEMGCNEGTTSLFIRRLLDYYNSDKELYVYDSFQGLPKKEINDYNEEEFNKQFITGGLSVPKELLIKNFRDAKLRPPIIHKGWFEEIPDLKIPKEIAFAFFDGDFYSSIIDSFNKIYPRLVPESRIVIDDYKHGAIPGVKKACDHFLQNKPEKNRIIAEGNLG